MKDRHDAELVKVPQDVALKTEAGGSESFHCSFSVVGGGCDTANTSTRAAKMVAFPVRGQLDERALLWYRAR